MSAGDLKAEAVVELETSSLETATKKVEKEFKKIGDSATKSGQKSDKAMGKTGQAASKAATKVKEVGTAGTAAGDKVQQGANKGATALDKMGTSADGAATGMETLSTSMIGIAQGATGISDAIFGLSASFVGLEKTGFGIKGMEIAIRRMEEDLVVAYKTGAATTRELERSVEDLELAYEGLSLEEKQVDADTLALNGQIVTLTINIAATVVQTIIAISVLKTMRLVTAQNALATTGDSAAKVVNTGVTTTMTGAILASAGAVKAFTLSMILSPLAPFAVAAIGVGLAFIALNDNIGGVRDSVENLTGSERGSFPTLGFSITGLGENMNTAEESLLAYGEEAENFTGIIGSSTDSINGFIDALNPGATTALDDFGTSLGNVTDKLIPFANGIFDAAGNLVNLNDRQSNTNKVFDQWSKHLLTANDGLKEQNKLLDENTKKKQQIQKLANSIRDSEGTFLEDNLESLFGKTGIFSRSGQNILGFHDQVFTFGNEELGFRDFRSRITSPSSVSPLGGGETDSAFASGGPTSAAGIAALGSNATRAGQGNQKGVNDGGGSPNRHDNFQALKALDARFGGDRSNALSLEEQTGISLQLTFTQNVQRGRSGPRHFDFVGLDTRIAEANLRISLAAQINAINPVLGVTARQSSQELQSILNQQNANVQSISNTLSLSTENVIGFNQTSQGQTDLANMIAFQTRTQQEMLVATTV